MAREIQPLTPIAVPAAVAPSPYPRQSGHPKQQQEATEKSEDSSQDAASADDTAEGHFDEYA